MLICIILYQLLQLLSLLKEEADTDVFFVWSPVLLSLSLLYFVFISGCMLFVCCISFSPLLLLLESRWIPVEAKKNKSSRQEYFIFFYKTFKILVYKRFFVAWITSRTWISRKHWCYRCVWSRSKTMFAKKPEARHSKKSSVNWPATFASLRKSRNFFKYKRKE